MKYNSLILCYGFFSTVTSKCFQHPKPTEKGFMTEIPCEYVDPTQKQATKQKLVGNADLKTSGSDPNNMFQVNLSCSLDSATCAKVKNTFDTATSYLSNIIKFKTPVTVQASYYSFCQQNGDCSTSQITLGKRFEGYLFRVICLHFIF